MVQPSCSVTKKHRWRRKHTDIKEEAYLRMQLKHIHQSVHVIADAKLLQRCKDLFASGIGPETEARDDPTLLRSK
jgi:hypothetical protein